MKRGDTIASPSSPWAAPGGPGPAFNRDLSDVPRYSRCEVVISRGWERHGWDCGCAEPGGDRGQGCDTRGSVPTLSPKKGRGGSIPRVGAQSPPSHSPPHLGPPEGCSLSSLDPK